MSIEILIVEDSRTQAELLAFVLQQHGYTVRHAADAGAALKMAREQRPVLVISDILMPEMDGYTLCQTFRHDATLCDIPIVLLTSLSDPEDIIRGLDCGADSFIAKPFDNDYLLSHIEHLLTRQPPTRAVPPGRPFTSAGQPGASHVDKEQVVKLLTTTFQEMVRQNRKLLQAQSELQALNEQLEKRVAERTQALHASEANYRTLLSANADAMLVVGQDHRVRYVNPAAEQLLGRSAAELLYRACDFLAVSEDRHEIQLQTNCPTPAIAEMRVVSTRWQGEVVDLVTLRDITDRKRAEEVLRSAYEALQQRIADHTSTLQHMGQDLQKEIAERQRAEAGQGVLIEHLKEATRSFEELSERVEQQHRETEQILSAIAAILIGVASNGRVIRWNAQAAATLGLSQEDIDGQPLHACQITWDSTAVLRGIADCHATGQPVRLDAIRYTGPNHTEGLLGLTISPMQEVDSHDLGVLILGQDITERRRLENQLAQAQKLEAIGQLAAGIAHEINTPTQYVCDNTRFLQDVFGDLHTLLETYTALCQAVREGREAHCLLGDIDALSDQVDVSYLGREIPLAIQESLDGLERIATIVRAMKDFSHPGVGEKTAIDLNAAIDTTLTVARNEWKFVAHVVKDFDPDLPMMWGLPGEMNQVILNVIVNAAHAIAETIAEGSEEKGTITVRTRCLQPWVEMRITDTGAGIPEDIRRKVFDPFFTTKEVGKGTGQGLSLAHAVVVEKHGGSMTFETQTGVGTTFIIRLPMATTEDKHKREHAA